MLSPCYIAAYDCCEKELSSVAFLGQLGSRLMQLAPPRRTSVSRNSHRDDAWSKSEIDRSWRYARLFRDFRRIRFGRIGASRSRSWRIWGILGTVVSEVPEHLSPASHCVEWTQARFTHTIENLCVQSANVDFTVTPNDDVSHNSLRNWSPLQKGGDHNDSHL